MCSLCDDTASVALTEWFPKGDTMSRVGDMLRRRRHPEKPREHLEAEQSVSVIQMYDDSENMRRIWLLVCDDQQPELGDQLEFHSIEGELLNPRVIPLEAFDAEWEGRPVAATVLSVLLPKDQLFEVHRGGECVLRVDDALKEQIIRERDGMMVNPSIDPWYERWIKEIGDPSCSDPAWLKSSSQDISFSIVVPLYRTPVDYLRDVLDSVMAQTYGSWQLILVNASPDEKAMKQVLSEYQDARISVIDLPRNESIAANTNEGIRRATGDYVCFLDHDDTLSSHALEQYARAIEEHPSAGVLYCDEDILSEDGACRSDPRFKPDLNKGLLLSHNYVVHLLCIKRSLLEGMQLPDAEVSGAQDYDMLLKALEAGAKPVHVPKVLYHWRSHEGSSGAARADCGKPYLEKACRTVVSRHLERTGSVAQVEAGPYFSTQRLVYPQTTQVCELIVVAQSSQEAAAVLESAHALGLAGEWSMTAVYPARAHERLMKPVRIEGQRVRTVPWHAGFDLAKMANKAIGYSHADVIVLCTDGIRFGEHTHIPDLVGTAAEPDVGIAFPRQIYADGLIRHAGMLVRHFDGEMRYLNHGFARGMGGGYHGTAELMCDFSAADPGCLVFERSAFLSVGGFDEQIVDDVIASADLCFSMRKLGLRIVGVQHCEVLSLRHAVWLDRRKPYRDLGNADLQYLKEKWGADWQGDVLDNPNVELGEGYFHLNVWELL